MERINSAQHHENRKKNPLPKLLSPDAKPESPRSSRWCWFL